MYLTLLSRLSDKRLAIALSFAYKVQSIDRWAEQFVSRFNGEVIDRRSSPEGYFLRFFFLERELRLVQIPDGNIWLVAGNEDANQALIELEEEIQISLGRVGGYDRRWPKEPNSIGEMSMGLEVSILAACAN